MLILRGKDRHQMQFYTLEDRIAPDNPVRFVDDFVDKIELQTKLTLLMPKIFLISLLTA
ncbi:MAG: hypothetical protein IPM26_01060 [Saprospiraceae bacterium]|nr:hypothetical protein [Saprospiraceae bacterium]